MLGVSVLTAPVFYSFLVLDGKLTPGVIPANGVSASLPQEWDVKKAKGSSGASVTFVGTQPVKAKVTLILFLAEHHDAWEEFRKTLIVDGSKKAVTALSVLHPVLNDLGVYSVVVGEIGHVEDQEDGSSKVTFELIQYFKPKPAAGTPTGTKPDQQSAGGDAGKDPATAVSQQDQEFLDIMDEVNDQAPPVPAAA